MAEPDETDSDESPPYAPPEVWEYGSIEELTEGFGDAPTDADSGTQA